MKRKVVKQGHNAMTITLPIRWVRDNNVSSGEEVNIEIREKDLLIQKGSKEGIEKTTFKMNGNEDFIHRHLGVLYRLGYDEIRIEFDDPSMVDKIQYELEEMLGFEIVDQGDNYCIIKNIATGLEGEFDNILRKIFLNILHCGEQSLICIKQNNFARLKSLKQLCRVNNRLPNFCQRLLKKEGYKEQKKTILIYSMVWSLEQVADYYNDIFKFLLEIERAKIDNGILKVYERINKLFEMYYILFYSFNSNELSNLKKECLDMIKQIRKITGNRNETEAFLLLSLYLIVERIYHMTECLI